MPQPPFFFALISVENKSRIYGNVRQGLEDRIPRDLTGVWIPEEQVLESSRVEKGCPGGARTGTKNRLIPHKAPPARYKKCSVYPSPWQPLIRISQSTRDFPNFSSFFFSFSILIRPTLKGSAPTLCRPRPISRSFFIVGRPPSIHPYLPRGHKRLGLSTLTN